MDNDLKCNRLTCRRALIDKAVVTTCSHIFCVDCANELFSAARLCPACETSLTEPDDVVVCSLHPSNDYKTSVLSGLNPATVLEICSRAISFWQYQIYQENSFQQAVLRNINDKNAQLQKQIDNVVREANGEINLLGSKISELERDLELERRKTRELQDATRERDKEYQKLKAQYDKIKRKALLAPNTVGNNSGMNLGGVPNPLMDRGPVEGDNRESRPGGPFVHNGAMANVDLSAVVGGMEANGIQRTPIINRTSGAFQQLWHQPQQFQERGGQRRQQFVQGDRPLRTATISERSDSVQEVEHLLGGGGNRTQMRMNPREGQWTNAGRTSYPTQQASSGKRRGFKPAGVNIPR